MSRSHTVGKIGPWNDHRGKPLKYYCICPTKLEHTDCHLRAKNIDSPPSASPFLARSCDDEGAEFASRRQNLGWSSLGSICLRIPFFPCWFLEGIYHYWKYVVVVFFRGLEQMEVRLVLFSWFSAQRILICK